MELYTPSTNDEINRLTPDVAAIISNDGYAMTDVITAISDDAASSSFTLVTRPSSYADS